MTRRLAAMMPLLLATAASYAQPIVVGSKIFPESYILAEIGAQLLQDQGFDVQRRLGMGGTKICYEALQTGAIDFYPEYTGTISEVILGRPDIQDLPDIQSALSARHLKLLSPIGFNNTYAIAASKDAGISRISDLRGRDDLRIAFPHEFLNRQDGWPGLRKLYGLTQDVDGIDHGLAYQAIEDGQLDVIVAYSTDGELTRYKLVLLEDDRGYFPKYFAAYLTHDRLPAGAQEVLERIGGRIDDARMQQLNRQAMQANVSIQQVAARFLREENLVSTTAIQSTVLSLLWRNTQRHLKLTGIALALAILVGVGIAMVVHRRRAFANAFLYFAGLLQTIPSIALLALLIPFMGIGQKPAILALFLYSLLPIARSTITALLAIPPGYRLVAAAMAMNRRQEFRYLLLPLAMPHVIAGIRTAAVISIGTATLAAFIGAGGLGDPIVTGLALNDSTLILQGAIPAALLAILTELIFSGVERALVVPHLRSSEPQA
jgi:osmoprotectant transport system substrate-binding protein/osmoprotectant transport system permease protein